MLLSCEFCGCLLSSPLDYWEYGGCRHSVCLRCQEAIQGLPVPFMWRVLELLGWGKPDLLHVKHSKLEHTNG